VYERKKRGMVGVETEYYERLIAYYSFLYKKNGKPIKIKTLKTIVFSDPQLISDTLFSFGKGIINGITCRLPDLDNYEVYFSSNKLELKEYPENYLDGLVNQYDNLIFYDKNDEKAVVINVSKTREGEFASLSFQRFLLDKNYNLTKIHISVIEGGYEMYEDSSFSVKSLIH
jgi:hypothetical protein